LTVGELEVSIRTLIQNDSDRFTESGDIFICQKEEEKERAFSPAMNCTSDQT
jgi:hypothetical protein